MKRIGKLIMLLFLPFGILIASVVVKANEFNFSVSAQLPDNQVNQNVSYFDLLLPIGEKQKLIVELSNSTDKTVIVEANVASATTNLNGVVEYSPNEIEPDKTLKYNIQNYAKISNEIILEPQTTQNVEIEVEMPNEVFSGVIAGGLTFKEKAGEASKEEGQGLTINNEYAYVVALLMRQNEEALAPNLELNEVVAGQVNYRNVINANLSNTQMSYLNQMRVEASVQGVDDTSVLYQTNKESMQMAPNTNFDFPVALNGERLKPGSYQLKMTVFGQSNPEGQYVAKNESGEEEKFDYRWEFTRDFIITAEEAKTLNKQDVTVKPENTWINWSAIGGVLLLLTFLLFIILWKRRKKEEQTEEELERIQELERLLGESSLS